MEDHDRMVLLINELRADELDRQFDVVYCDWIVASGSEIKEIRTKSGWRLDAHRYSRHSPLLRLSLIYFCQTSSSSVFGNPAFQRDCGL
jgi:hypothetical protein